MSLNQWKLLNQIKDSLAKLASSSSSSSNNNNNNNNNKLSLSSLFSTNNNNNNKLTISSKVAAAAEVLERFMERKNTIASTKPDHTNNIKWRGGGGGGSQTLIAKSSKSSIVSHTQRLLLSIESADNAAPQLLNQLETFIVHIKQYPEAKHNAVKNGAIRLLLRLKSSYRHPDVAVQGALREALTLLGYADAVPQRGIRILSMDGGGIRGLLILEMLKKLEMLTGRRVNDMFDLFCGVSTGAILSFSIGIHNKSLDEISTGYQAISHEVFGNQSALWGTGNLMWSHAYYNTSLWETKLKEHLGKQHLITTSRNPACPKLCAVSAIVNQSHLRAYIFRNYSLPWRVQSQFFGGSDYEVWQAARASAAAPTYFEEFRLGNDLHQDGGILVNNPTAIALHEAKLIWPGVPIQCIVSFGTGRTVPMMMSTTSAAASPSNRHAKSNQDNNIGAGGTTTMTSWANKFYKILDSATDTEGVHTTLNDLLPGNVYYRFNPYLTEMISMVETNPDKLEQLKRDAIMYLSRNEDKFQDAAKALMESKSVSQRVSDYVAFKRDLYGF